MRVVTVPAVNGVTSLILFQLNEYSSNDINLVKILLIKARSVKQARCAYYCLKLYENAGGGVDFELSSYCIS